jgi:hypothetical protein
MLELLNELSCLESFIKRYGREMSKERFKMIMDAIFDIRQEIEQTKKEIELNEAFKKGGLFFLDEMDGCSLDVLAELSKAAK